MCITEFKNGSWHIEGHRFYGDKCIDCGLPTADYEYFMKGVEIVCEVDLVTGTVRFPSKLMPD
jgi:hypothetical protein